MSVSNSLQTRARVFTRRARVIPTRATQHSTAVFETASPGVFETVWNMFWEILFETVLFTTSLAHNTAHRKRTPD